VRAAVVCEIPVRGAINCVVCVRAAVDCMVCVRIAARDERKRGQYEGLPQEEQGNLVH